jgi:sigma-B regulation protein RsbU (phosphoserine phosphatase)
VFIKDECGLPLGLDNNAVFADQSIQLSSGDVLVLYTDGLTEAMNKRGQLLGTSRIIQTLRDTRGGQAHDFLTALMQLAEGHEQGVRADDLSLLLMRVG